MSPVGLRRERRTHGERPPKRPRALRESPRTPSDRPAQRGARRRGALPTFLIIGAPKCGTTSLHRYLAAHPEIQMSRQKELRFFIDDFERPVDLPAVDRELVRKRGRWGRGVSWYRRQFDPAAPVRGEASVGYMNPWYRCADRIARLLPNTTLVVCVRDPIERAISSYRFLREGGIETRSIDAALSLDGAYAHQSRYASNLAPFLERFPLERFHFVEAERLASERRTVMRELYAAIGAEPDFWSAELERRWNVTGTSLNRGPLGAALLAARRLPWWQLLSDRAPGWIRRRTFSVESAARSELGADQRPSAATLETMRGLLGADAERLRSITALPFAGWSV